VATPAGAVAARALSVEGDDPGLTDRVGPPVSEREVMAESDKWLGRCPMKVMTPSSLTGWAHLSARGRRRPNRTSGAGRIGQEAQALSDEGDDPRLTDRVGPPISEREATAESDKRSRPVAKFSKEMTWAIKVDRAKLTMGCGKFFSKFSNNDLGFKIKDFKFQTKI
jgi:hypothetical protein